MKSKPIIIVAILLLLIIVVIEMFRPKKSDWTAYFDYSRKKPFSISIFKEILQEKYPSKVEITNKNLNDLLRRDSSSGSSIFIINDHYRMDVKGIDVFSMNKLISWIEKGNDAFIFTTSFNEEWYNRFDLDIGKDWIFTALVSDIPIDTLGREINFLNPNLRSDTNYRFSVGNFNYYFEDLLDSNVSQISFYQRNRGRYPNMIKYSLEEGNLYISTLPYMFTNYNILYQNKEILEKTLSYLNKTDRIMLDNYYKHSFISTNKGQSPLRYIYSQRALKWAFLILLFGSFLFMIFGFKRKQKAIPIIVPPKNVSLDFSYVIRDLFLERSTNKRMLIKKFKFMMNVIRRKYYLNTNNIDDEFFKALSHKSQVEEKNIINLFMKMRRIESMEDISIEELKSTTNEIEKIIKG